MLHDHTETQLVPKLLPQLYLRELNNRIVSDPNYGCLKDARDEDDNFIISDFIFHSLLSHQLIKIPHDKRSCMVVNVVFLLKVYIHHCYPCVIGI